MQGRVAFSNGDLMVWIFPDEGKPGRYFTCWYKDKGDIRQYHAKSLDDAVGKATEIFVKYEEKNAKKKIR
jgi:hypothetical protein